MKEHVNKRQKTKKPMLYLYPVDIFGTVVGESPDCLLLSWTVVGENPDYVCWVQSYSSVASLASPSMKSSIVMIAKVMHGPPSYKKSSSKVKWFKQESSDKLTNGQTDATKYLPAKSLA